MQVLMMMVIFIIILSFFILFYFFFSPPLSPLPFLLGSRASPCRRLGRSMALEVTLVEVAWAAQPGPRGPTRGSPPLLPPMCPLAGPHRAGQGGQGSTPLAVVLWGGRKRSTEAEEVPEPRRWG